MGQVKEMDDGTAHAKMSTIHEEHKIKIRSVRVLTEETAVKRREHCQEYQ